MDKFSHFWWHQRHFCRRRGDESQFKSGTSVGASARRFLQFQQGPPTSNPLPTRLGYATTRLTFYGRVKAKRRRKERAFTFTVSLRKLRRDWSDGLPTKRKSCAGNSLASGEGARVRADVTLAISVRFHRMKCGKKITSAAPVRCPRTNVPHYSRARRVSGIGLRIVLKPGILSSCPRYTSFGSCALPAVIQPARQQTEH